jgi:flavin reductase (DIM6/NTAB) family NADH-FMN oxidoreductase RutF
MEWIISHLDETTRHRLINECVIPRPIAWISTLNAAGGVNVAPFSYFSIASTEPLLVSVSISRHEDGRMKDTARNLLDQGECVIHLPSRGHAPSVMATGAPFPPEQSEAEILGLALMPAQQVMPPRLVECGIVLEGRLYRHIEIGEPAAADLLLVEILQIGVADELIRPDQRIHFDPLTRLGGPDFGVLGERFQINRK